MNFGVGSFVDLYEEISPNDLSKWMLIDFNVLRPDLDFFLPFNSAQVEDNSSIRLFWRVKNYYRKF